MEPLRSDVRPAEALSGSEREARIEQLLLAGLDEYFAHRYEHAINLWTRVLFLDRQHDRARAYIERARRAQGERLRESEALLQQGLDAFRAGDVPAARRLVAEALDRGASGDEAQGLLERIERLGLAQTAPMRRRPGAAYTVRPLPSPEVARRHHGRGWFAAVLLAAAAVGVLAVAIWGVTVPDVALWPAAPVPPAMPAGATRPPESLPVVRASEAPLARAREHLAMGRLRDALRELDRISVGDSLRPEADRVRAEVQRRLLLFAAGPASE